MSPRHTSLFFVSVVLTAMLVLFLAMAAPGKDGAPAATPTPPQQNEKSQSFLPGRSKSIDRWGEITIAQPKIWQYERVNALLDGLLRDVEGVSVADLTQLNPNSQNAAAVRFIQSALGIAVQFDQAALVNNRNIQENFQIQHDSQVQQFNQYNAYIQTLTTQRNNLTNELLAANNTVDTLQALQAGGPLTPDQTKELAEARSRASNAQAQLTSVNSLISGAGAAPTLTAPPTLQGTGAQLPQTPNFSAFGDVLKSLPDGVQKNLTSALQSPSYPATKQLDNFLTLLQERLAREISVLQDDLTRDPDQLAFLVQFDVGLYPSDKTKNHMARVEFELKDCTGCKVYSLYPGQSSYNVANYQGASRRRSFAGNFLSLIGLGISASYQRQEDSLQGSLVQSVYISGFQDDTEYDLPCEPGEHVNQRFGWYYNAAPFDQYVTPGIRSTFAIVTIPRTRIGGFRPKLVARTTNATGEPLRPPECVEDGTVADTDRPDTNNPADSRLTISVRGDWTKRDNPLYQKPHWHGEKYLGDEMNDSLLQKIVTVRLPGIDGMRGVSEALSGDRGKLHVLRIEYNPVYNKESVKTTEQPSPSPSPALATAKPPGSVNQNSYDENGCKRGNCIAVLLTLDVPIDPNLVITVRGTPLHRVRDWRGRATSILPPAQSTSDLPQGGGAGSIQIKTQNPRSRSLLETDQVEPDSWFAVGSHDLLLNISRETAGDEEFPIIQVSDPAKRTLVIPDDLRQNHTEIITSGFRFLPASEVPDYVRTSFWTRPQATSSTPIASPGGPYPPSPGGPYPSALFLPLFAPEPTPLRFYAYVGKTGEDLLIGVSTSPSSDGSLERRYYPWLESRTQVILVDPFLYLSWPLRCDTQGQELVCKIPTDYLLQIYEQIVNTCHQRDQCPDIWRHLAPLDASMKDSPAQDSGTISSAFLPDLQVWIEQSDPQHTNAFWSPEPATIGLLPLSADFGEHNNFKPWHFFTSATTEDDIALEECDYFPSAGGGTPEVAFLASINLQFPNTKLTQPVQPIPSQIGRCGYITLPTATLQNREVVLKMNARNDVTFTAPVSTSRLRPEFGRPKIETDNDTAFRTRQWTVSIPVSRALCTDDLEIPDPLTKAGFKVDWYDGAKLIHPTDPEFARKDGGCWDLWWDKEATGEIQLRLTIPRASLGFLPEKIALIRTTSTGVNVPVASLNPRHFIFPARLKLEPLDATQFLLSGENAGLIDSVVLQDGKTARTFSVARGGSDSVFVNTAPPAPSTGNATSTKPKPPAVQPTVQTPPDPPTQSPCPGQPAATCSKPPNPAPSSSPTASANSNTKPPAKAPARSSSQKPENLPPGTYAVLPLVLATENTKTKTYLSIDVTDSQNKPLVFTVPKADQPAKAPSPAADETITITKTKKQPSTTASTTGASQ